MPTRCVFLTLCMAAYQQGASTELSLPQCQEPHAVEITFPMLAEQSIHRSLKLLYSIGDFNVSSAEGLHDGVEIHPVRQTCTSEVTDKPFASMLLDAMSSVTRGFDAGSGNHLRSSNCTQHYLEYGIKGVAHKYDMVAVRMTTPSLQHVYSMPFPLELQFPHKFRGSAKNIGIHDVAILSIPLVPAPVQGLAPDNATKRLLRSLKEVLSNVKITNETKKAMNLGTLGQVNMKETLSHTSFAVQYEGACGLWFALDPLECPAEELSVLRGIVAGKARSSASSLVRDKDPLPPNKTQLITATSSFAGYTQEELALRKWAFAPLFVAQGAAVVGLAVFVFYCAPIRKSAQEYEELSVAESDGRSDKMMLERLDQISICSLPWLWILLLGFLALVVYLPLAGRPLASCDTGFPWEIHLKFSTFVTLMRFTECGMLWYAGSPDRWGVESLLGYLIKIMAGTAAAADMLLDGNFVVVANACEWPWWNVALVIFVVGVGILQFGVAIVSSMCMCCPDIKYSKVAMFKALNFEIVAGIYSTYYELTIDSATGTEQVVERLEPHPMFQYLAVTKLIAEDMLQAIIQIWFTVLFKFNPIVILSICFSVVVSIKGACDACRR